MTRPIKFRALSFGHPRKWMYVEFIGDEWPYLSLEGSEGQFTGLTDKNGKEIYEGDIVKFLGKTKRDKIRTYVIVWQPDRLRFIGKHIAYEDQLMPVRLMATDHEIIGNIYENPELKGALV